MSAPAPASDTAAHAVALPGSDRAMPVGVYVHWPFCEKKCPYCDFNSHVRPEVDHDRWRRALVREIRETAALYPRLTTRSVFFGGGTPSLMDPHTTAAVLTEINRAWPMEQNAEITLEANPSSVEAGRFRAFADAGVNRLSVGVQSFDDDALRFLGRLHDSAAARRALDVAFNSVGRVSFDLITGRPDQSLSAWQAELDEALAYGPDHISLYQLTIEPGTAFAAQHARGRFTMPDEDHAAALFRATRDRLHAAGLPAYEVSNHARPDMESRHNLIYWTGGAHVGIGPGAHGRLPAHSGPGALATATHKRPERWLSQVEKSGLGLIETTPVPAQERLRETIMTGLRLTEGLSLDDLKARFGDKAVATALDSDGLALLRDQGFLQAVPDRLVATEKGFLVLNGVIAAILA
ncbi:radical SAM family heme chaperone HemW [Yunchengibacter salinarum]|uniref:radical SAM family heme chaperone HemW n=1 Tax=Yunchengibacter salinarum TaxID=3133399 RepID=UPI0035B62AAF